MTDPSSIATNRIKEPLSLSFLDGPWMIIVVLCVWLLINIPSLLTYPSVTSDEGQFSAVAWNFAKHGDLRLPIVGPLGRERNTGIFQGRLYICLLGLGFQVFGLGLIQARAISLVGAGVAGC